MARANSILRKSIPEWRVHGNYFPLEESGLTLQDIAYFNLVRCRTLNNSRPRVGVVRNCLGHFERWLMLLQPKVLIFIGKWAHDRAGRVASARGVPIGCINRDRSLNASERAANRDQVASLVRKVPSA
jgi:uracil-DNA glycosylase